MSSESTTTAPVNDRDAALAVDGLVRKFGEIVAVDDVTLDVADGEIRSIIGPNGAGKTTLFNLIMGRLSPMGGSIELHGNDLTEKAEEQRPHEGIARAFQSNQLFVSETVFENVRIVAQHAETGTFSLDLFRDGSEIGGDRAREIIETVGLEDVREKEASNLSHGNQRRLGIAMALATDPEVLLLDEPTSGLSPTETNETADLIEEIHDEYGLTVLLIEHDMDVVLSISDQITVLNQGAIITTGSPDAVQDNDEVQSAYLGGVEDEL